MPNAAPKPCIQCGALVHDGSSRCVLHKVKTGSFADRRRGSRHSRGYDSKWVATTKRIKLRDNGLCQQCLPKGIVHEGHEVDHRVSKAAWQRLHGSLAGCDDDSNLWLLHRDCHAAKTQAEAQAARGVGAAADTPRGGQILGVGGQGTDLFVKFSRSGNSTGGGIPTADEEAV